jgi:hypothetical protein
MVFAVRLASLNRSLEPVPEQRSRASAAIAMVRPSRQKT